MRGLLYSWKSFLVLMNKTTGLFNKNPPADRAVWTHVKMSAEGFFY